jgi:hypothetical protein
MPKGPPMLARPHPSRKALAYHPQEATLPLFKRIALILISEGALTLRQCLYFLLIYQVTYFPCTGLALRQTQIATLLNTPLRPNRTTP